MARRVERNLDAVAGKDLAVLRRFDGNLAEAFLKDRRGVTVADIDVRPEPRMVGMAVGDHRARDRAPGIDMKIAGGAKEAAIGRNDEVHGARRNTDCDAAGASI